MTLTVSVSELRSNLAQYLQRVANGDNLLVRDEKKEVTIAQITKTQTFDKDLFEQSLKKAAGIFTAQRHPEWRTKSLIINWLRKRRLKNQRIF